jgi:hypothetical protein
MLGVNMVAHRQFLTQLKNFDSEARNAARYVYADFAIQYAASKSKRLLNRLNDTPTFWLTVSAAFQTAAYISLGRIFDNNSRYNVYQLLCSAESNISLFQREALAERKREDQTSDPPWLAEYIDNAYYPNPSDFARLRKRVDEYHELYKKTIKPARNKYIAHREKQDHEEVAALFRRAKVKDLWRLTIFLQQLYEVLWELFHNGRKPRFRQMRYSVAAMFEKPPRGSSAHEAIVRETQKLMQFIDSGTLNSPLQGTRFKRRISELSR